VDLIGADLTGAGFSWANLNEADLTGADFSRANLNEADLREANLEYTNITMWCGALKDVRVDFRLVCQMLLHVYALKCGDKRFVKVKKAIEKYAKLSDKWHYYERAMGKK
jgi:hypothetical protein